MAAPGSGAHLVHENRRDPGDDGQDQPTLTACISGKSQPWNCRSSTLHTDGGASGTGLEGRTFFLLSSRPRRHRVRPVIGRKYKLPAGSFLPFLGVGSGPPATRQRSPVTLRRLLLLYSLRGWAANIIRGFFYVSLAILIVGMGTTISDALEPSSHHYLPGDFAGLILSQSSR